MKCGRNSLNDLDLHFLKFESKHDNSTTSLTVLCFEVTIAFRWCMNSPCITYHVEILIRWSNCVVLDLNKNIVWLVFSYKMERKHRITCPEYLSRVCDG